MPRRASKQKPRRHRVALDARIICLPTSQHASLELVNWGSGRCHKNSSEVTRSRPHDTELKHQATTRPWRRRRSRRAAPARRAPPPLTTQPPPPAQPAAQPAAPPMPSIEPRGLALLSTARPGDAGSAFGPLGAFGQRPRRSGSWSPAPMFAAGVILKTQFL